MMRMKDREIKREREREQANSLFREIKFAVGVLVNGINKFSGPLQFVLGSIKPLKEAEAAATFESGSPAGIGVPLVAGFAEGKRPSQRPQPLTVPFAAAVSPSLTWVHDPLKEHQVHTKDTPWHLSRADSLLIDTGGLLRPLPDNNTWQQLLALRLG